MNSKNSMNSSEMLVNEIFFSIQGESSYMGIPCIFIRLTGCNLRCTYCDTQYAYYKGREMTVEEILHAVEGYSSKSSPSPDGLDKLVEVTGGEPLLQEKSISLMDALIKRGYRVLLETNGTMGLAGVNAQVVKIMDIKCPSSGMVSQNRYENIAHLSPKDEVKFVIGSEEDYTWAKECIERFRLLDRCQTLFSPAWGLVEPRWLAQRVLEDELKVRFQLQLQKYIWGPWVRGV